MVIWAPKYRPSYAREAEGWILDAVRDKEVTYDISPGHPVTRAHQMIFSQARQIYQRL